MRGYGNQRLNCLFTKSGNNMLVILVGKKKYTKPQKTKSRKPAGPVNCQNDGNHKPRKICNGNIIMGKKQVDCYDNILPQVRCDISHNIILLQLYLLSNGKSYDINN